MIIVSDKKIIKHAMSTGDALVDIPVRVTFEYTLEDQQFVPRSMSRKALYNIGPVLRRFATLDRDELERAIDRTVDRALEEHLRYAGQLSGAADLYPEQVGTQPAGTVNADPDLVPEDDGPRIILPR